MSYFLSFAFSFVVVFLLTPIIRRIAVHLQILDDSNRHPERKILRKPIPLLGGSAVILGFSLVLIFFTFFTDHILGGYLLIKHILGILAASLILMIGGYFTDRYDPKPLPQLLAPILAFLVVIVSGIGISYIRNPFGGVFDLETWNIELFRVDGIPYHLTLWADLFALMWLFAMTFTTKLLDGLDGLVTGIGVIGALIIVGLSITRTVGQPETAFVAAIFAGSLAGFLPWNFHPAKIFLGEGGSTLVGFLLGTLAILSGAKIATALLILGIPLLDMIWIIVRRVMKERRSPLFADRKHLHFRLLDLGLSHRQAVLVLYVMTLVFGLSSLFLESQEKLYALGVLVFVMGVLAAVVVGLYRKKEKGKSHFNSIE